MAEHEDLISVIVPVHNGQEYLEKCIDSIEAQSYACLEIIVINDGSTDGTAHICRKLQEKYSNVSIIDLPDIGVAAARNRAIKQARGSYISFVDADDRLLPDMIKRLYDSLLITDSDVAGCRFITWSTETEWKDIVEQDADKNSANDNGIVKSPQGQEVYEVYDSYHYLTDCLLRENSRCWSKLYRRSVIAKVRFREDLTIGEDMLFLVDLLHNVNKAVELEYQGYGYYQNPVGLMRRSFRPSYMDQIKCWELAKEEILVIDADLEAQANAKLMIAVMLTVGKIAMLSGREYRKFRDYLTVCREKMALYSGIKESYEYLPKGYRFKVRLFSQAPVLYVKMYHLFRQIKG